MVLRSAGSLLSIDTKVTKRSLFKYGAFGTRILICGGKSKCLRSDAPTTLVVLISLHRNENPLIR